MSIIKPNDFDDPDAVVSLLQSCFSNQLAGYIVVGINTNKGMTTVYWCGGGGGYRFFDENKQEIPYIYASRKNAEKSCKKIIESGDWNVCIDWQVRIWVHPEADYQPALKHYLTTGTRFPSSPSQ